MKTMKQVIERVITQEQILDDLERQAVRVDLSKLTDAELRSLQVQAIRSKPEAEWTRYERWAVSEGEAGR